MKAPFVAFEGIDKSGKGTQALIAADLLKRTWGDCVFFSEPNDRDSLIGRHIRRILKGEQPVPALDDFQRLYVIDRAQDTVSTVLPALAKGIPVVAERFALSTIAYGMLEGKAPHFVQMHREVLGPWLRWPDLTVIIDIPVEVAILRLARERGKPEYFEKAEKLRRIRENYRWLADYSGQFVPEMRVVLLDGQGEVAQVAERVAGVLESYAP
jgi:dTMP kinase